MRSSRQTSILAWTSIFLLIAVVDGLSEVTGLSGYADYRYVALSWDYDVTDPDLYGFQIHYCELQIWGPHRCKAKSLAKEAVAVASTSSRQQRNSYIVPGLRMSTNYTFEVIPVANKRMDREFHNPAMSKAVVLATKGFSAKATLCLPTESEIEVSTGPYFGGRVGVETVDGTRCTVDGDANSPRDVYTLRINHQACGSVVNETTVATFVLVQENLPILTHSTRRFLVLCTVQPDTLTVRARLSLPHRSSNSVDDEESQEAHGYIKSTELPSDNPDLNPHDGRRRDGRMLRLQQDATAGPLRLAKFMDGESITQLVLMMVLVTMAAVGCATFVWYIAREPRQVDHNDTTINASLHGDGSISPEPSEINFEIESVCGLSGTCSSPNMSVHYI